MNVNSGSRDAYLSEIRCKVHIIAITLSCCTSVIQKLGPRKSRARQQVSLTKNLHQFILISLEFAESKMENTLIFFSSLRVQSLPLPDIQKRRNLPRKKVRKNVVDEEWVLLGMKRQLS
jgi:hypothetical protein